MERDGSRRRYSRRQLLKTAAIGSAALAGCTDLFRPDDVQTPVLPSDTPTGTPFRTVTETPTDEPPIETDEPTETEEPTETPEPQPTSLVFIDRDQLDAVARKVRSGTQPWKKSYERAMHDAEKAMGITPRSVVDDGAPKWNDPHRFGRTDEFHDYQAAIVMTRAVRDLALAYWFTRNDDYAERAIDYIYHWCMDPETYMKPNPDIVWNGTEIQVLITIPKLWYAAALLRDHPYWDEKNGAALESEFRDWVRTWVSSLPDPGYYQYDNHWAWRIATIASAASYLGDDDLLEHAFCMWRGECETAAYDQDQPRPWNQYRQWGISKTKGILNREINREDGLRYHMYGMKALTLTAEIARHHGVDLYNFNAPTDPEPGSTLKKLFEFMAPYLLDISTWKWGLGEEGLTQLEKLNHAALYELAYSEWGDDIYLEVVNKHGRPAYDFWMLGWATLTHGNRFDLDL